MAFEHVAEERRQADGALRVCLGRTEFETAVYVFERAAHVQNAAEQVDVLPL
jgi:hypothetical protein